MSDPSLSPLCNVERLHTNDINCCAFSPDGRRFASASSDRLAVVVDCDSSSAESLKGVSAGGAGARRSLAGHKYHVNVCTFSPDGDLLATGSTDCSVRVWNVETGQCTATVSGQHRGAVRGLAFSADGTHLLSTASDDSLAVVDVVTATCVKFWKAQTEGVIQCCAWTSHGWHVVVGSSSGHLMVWDAFECRCLTSMRNAHDLGVCCLVHYLADSEYVATGGTDSNIRLWRLNDQAGSAQLLPLYTLCGHTSAIYTLAMSPDKNYLLSGSSDKTIRLWKLETKKDIAQGSGHLGFVSCCSFSPCGRFALSSGGDRVLRIWQLLLNDGSLTASALTSTAAAQTPDGPAEKWSVDDVCQWLSSLKLGKHAATFREADMDGSTLGSLHAQQLFKSFAIESPSERHAILCSVSELFPSSRSVPNEFLCPISMEIMRDPVVASDGFSYERSAIVAWITSGRHTSPLTNLPLTSSLVFTNNNLLAVIKSHLEHWQKDNSSTPNGQDSAH